MGRKPGGQWVRCSYHDMASSSLSSRAARGLAVVGTRRAFTRWRPAPLHRDEDLLLGAAGFLTNRLLLPIRFHIDVAQAARAPVRQSVQEIAEQHGAGGGDEESQQNFGVGNLREHLVDAAVQYGAPA